MQLDMLKFSADFYVLEMNTDRDEVPILLGRPFLRTSKTKIDVEKGSLTIKFNDKKVEFHVFDTKTQPIDKADISMVEVIEPNLPDLFEVHVGNDIEIHANPSQVLGFKPTELTLHKEKCALSDFVQGTETKCGGIQAILKERKRMNKKRRRKHRQRKNWMPLIKCFNCFQMQDKSLGKPDSSQC